MNEKKGERRSLLLQAIEFVSSPRSTFRSIRSESGIRKSLLLISTIAIIASLASYNYRGKYPQSQTIISPIMTLIGIFTSWLISSSLLHLFLRAQGEKSTLRYILILTGYASTPFLIQHMLRLVDSFTISPKQLLQLMIRSQIFENQFLNSVLNSVLDKFNIFLFWSLYLQVIALQENYKISKNRSILTVIVTLIMMLLVTIFLPF